MLIETAFFKQLAEKINVPFVDLNTIELNASIATSITEKIARLYGIIPIDSTPEEIVIAMSDPTDVQAIEDVKFYTKKSVKVVLATPEAIIDAINKCFTQTEKAELALQYLGNDEDKIEDSNVADIDAAPIVRMVNSIFQDALNMRASDIHIEPFDKSVRVRFRVDGELKEISALPKNSLSGIVARIKVMSDLNIAETKRPQDGRMQITSNQKQVNMRVSIIPAIYGEKIVIRVLSNEGGSLTKEQIGLSQKNMMKVEQLLKITEGVILLTGPTGSGKTTTLYAILRDFNSPTNNIITLEDPVEYRMAGVNQVQVNSQVGMTFASGLRSILRQDPDVIMLGEIRDEETAQIAIRAAVTGHVVLSTLHTNDTVSSISRLTDMGIPVYMVNSAISGIIAQRLIRKICPQCAEEYHASEAEKRVLSVDGDVILKRGRGCPYCGQTGYKGRTAIHEVLVLNREIREKVSCGCSNDEIKIAAIEGGMETLETAAINLALAGVTTVEQVVKTTFSLG